MKAYKHVEEQANKACDEAIQKALAVRVESERNDRETYEKALERTAKAYEESVDEALKVCCNTIEE